MQWSRVGVLCAAAAAVLFSACGHEQTQPAGAENIAAIQQEIRNIQHQTGQEMLNAGETLPAEAEDMPAGAEAPTQAAAQGQAQAELPGHAGGQDTERLNEPGADPDAVQGPGQSGLRGYAQDNVLGIQEGEGELIVFNDIQEGDSYTDKESVAYYIHSYHCLPPNYITKSQARKLGWNQNNNLWEVAPGKSIGGGLYPLQDKALPQADGRIWYECDIDYQGGERGRKRILYSNDELIYYTEDNEHFEQLY